MRNDEKIRNGFGNWDRRKVLTALGAAPLVAAAPLGIVRAAAGTAGTPVKGGTLTAGMAGGTSADSLDPASWANEVTKIFGRQWGEQLVQISPEGDLIPVLAEEWSASADARVWTFKIRQGVEFHDGRTMTPDDVVATIERHADAASQSGAAGILSPIREVARKGDSVIITLDEGNADLPYLLEDYHLMIQPNGGKDAPAAGIGTGPYRVAVHEAGSRLVGERFANYWRRGSVGHADHIIILVINDSTARVAALQARQVDMINRVEPKTVEMLTRVPGIDIHNVPGKGYNIFACHCDTAPFDNNDLRLALKHAIDRQEMIDTVLQGYGSLGNDFPINASYPLFTDDIEQRQYDPDLARHHYQKSGHDGPIVLRVSDAAFPGAVDAAQLFQRSAARAGITLELKREPDDGYWTEVWNAKPFCASYWNGRPTQDQVYSTAYTTDADWNDTRFRRADFDALVRQARAELDEDKRRALYRDMALTVRDEGGLILPMFNNFIDASLDRVKGWTDDGNMEMGGGNALSHCWIEE